MKKHILLQLFFFCSMISLSQKTKEEIIDLRENHLTELLDSTSGILTNEEINDFEGLNYFAFDSTYQVIVKFTREKGKKFKMATSTDRMPVYRKYGYIEFTLKDTSCRLVIYQSMESRKSEIYKDYLFIPFRDHTSAKSTYGGGRYLDILIPDKSQIFIDFNLAYNPYCAYSYRYSCPIPPDENRLHVSILAGEKTPNGH